jgi:tetratricopeptide (TPR) repeat protein
VFHNIDHLYTSCSSPHSYLPPSFPLFKVNTGNALRDSGRLDEALQCYRSALEMKPDHPHGWNNMGNALKDRGEREEEGKGGRG